MTPSSPAPSSQPEPSVQSTKVIRFGVFEVDLRTEELRKQGVRIRLPSQSFQVLEALLLRPGELVTREELKQKLWPSDTFGDFEHGLNAAVNRVRDALGDSSDNPRFVETLPRRGYRFIAPVEQTPLAATSSTSQNGQIPSGTHPEPQVHERSPVDTGRRRRTIRVGLFALAALFAILLGRLYLMHRNGKTRPEKIEADVRVSPLTTLPGKEMWPSLSPDGKQVVFAWDGGRKTAISTFDLYKKVIGAEQIEQLTHSPAEAIIPAWSPDGGTIAFIRANGPEREILTMSVLGGPARKLASFTDSFYYIEIISLSWSPDGKRLVYAFNDDVQVLTFETGETHTIARPLPCKRAVLPIFSPDGKWIAFLCAAAGGTRDIYRISPEGEQAKNLHTFLDIPYSMGWSGDSRRIIFGLNGALHEMDVNGGDPRRLSFAQDGVGLGLISTRGNRLVYVQMQNNVNIWRVDMKSGSTRSLLAPTSRQQRAPNISPDGKRVAFESDRSGSQEVWAANLDGSDAVQLSNFHVQTGTPRWSPDGRKIVFDSRPSGELALYLADPATAIPRRIPTNGIPAAVPSWSRDGKWIYFTSISGHSVEEDILYKVSPEGGVPQLVSKTHGYNVQESKDGRTLYFFAGEANAPIHSLDIATGVEQPLKGMPAVGDPTAWVLGSKGIFCIDHTSTPAAVAFYEFATARVTKRVPIDRQPEEWGGLALSPDETWVAYSQSDTQGSDLMLAEGVQ